MRGVCPRPIATAMRPLDRLYGAPIPCRLTTHFRRTERMAGLEQQIARLDAALDRLEQALMQREDRLVAELADARAALDAEAEGVAANVDRAIMRLESLLGH